MPQDCGIRTAEAHLDLGSSPRAEDEFFRFRLRIRKLLPEKFLNFRQYRVNALIVLYRDEQLTISSVGLFRTVNQSETRRTRSYKRGHGCHFLHAHQIAFNRFHIFGGFQDMRTFDPPVVNHKLRARGRREKAVFDKSEAVNGKPKKPDHQGTGQLSPVQAHNEKFFVSPEKQPPIKVFFLCPGFCSQEHRAEQRCHGDSQEPAHHQRNEDHLKQGSAEFAHSSGCKTDSGKCKNSHHSRSQQRPHGL